MPPQTSPPASPLPTTADSAKLHEEFPPRPEHSGEAGCHARQPPRSRLPPWSGFSLSDPRSLAAARSHSPAGAAGSLLSRQFPQRGSSPQPAQGGKVTTSQTQWPGNCGGQQVPGRGRDVLIGENTKMNHKQFLKFNHLLTHGNDNTT